VSASPIPVAIIARATASASSVRPSSVSFIPPVDGGTNCDVATGCVHGARGGVDGGVDSGADSVGGPGVVFSSLGESGAMCCTIGEGGRVSISESGTNCLGDSQGQSSIFISSQCPVFNKNALGESGGD
jgi:hypothetical protein